MTRSVARERPASRGRAPVARVFLLSPADCSGARARLLLDGSSLALARRLRSDGAPLGEVFSFLSGLYFRGKLAYARAFARPPAALGCDGACGAFVITAGAGLLPIDRPIALSAIRRFARVAVDPGNPSYRRPLERTAAELCERIGRRTRVILLGSIATPKYLSVLGAVFGDRLAYPRDFVGLGDMSRGSLMLRAVASGTELDYVSAGIAVDPAPASRRPHATRGGRRD